jgi:purine-nucleoside phosphorylase
MTEETTTDTTFSSYRQAAAYLAAILDTLDFSYPTVGIICGSGLSGLSKTLTKAITIKYLDVPGFPSHTTVAGHKGEIVIGLLNDSVPAICFRGRFHSYEGHDMNTVALPVRIMRCVGVKLLIVTNAAGGVNPSYNIGDVVNVMDYFALPMLAGKNPLVGPNDDELGSRFPPVSNAFDSELQDVVVKAAETVQMEGFIRKDGTYCFVSGPMYESKAECRFLRSVGGDSVGMSTVPEIVAAHHSGMKVICLSLITNKVVVSGDEGPPASHQEVLDAVNTRSEQVQDLVKEVVKELKESGKLDAMPDLGKITLEVVEDGKKKSITLCPYHIIKNITMHGWAMGFAAVAFGAILYKKKI